MDETTVVKATATSGSGEQVPYREDAVQEGVNDAWLITALGAVAGHRPEVIRAAVRVHRHESAATVRLHEVVMNYLTGDWTPTGETLLLEVPADAGRLPWPRLIEAAYAAVDSTWSIARREAIPERGFPRLDDGATIWEAAEMLAQLTGIRTGIVTLDPDTADLVVRYHLAMRRPVLLGTRPAIDTERRPDAAGLYPDHAYEITNIGLSGHMDLRNPWGVLHATGVPLSTVLEACSGLIVTVRD